MSADTPSSSGSTVVLVTPPVLARTGRDPGGRTACGGEIVPRVAG